MLRLAVVLDPNEKQMWLVYGRWRELTRVLAALSVEFFRYPAKALSKIFYIAISLHNISKA